jgi:hypothetical protein
MDLDVILDGLDPIHIVDEAVFTKDGDGRAKGILLEADRLT